MARPAGKLWVIAALLLIAAESYAQSCPHQIRGGWQSQLAAKTLLEISLSVRVSDGDEYSARLGSADGEERLGVWRDGQTLRLQSTRLPLSFDGRLSGDGRKIDGFIAYAANLYRVSLVADSAKSWSVSWNPLPVKSETVSLDLYFDGGRWQGLQVLSEAWVAESFGKYGRLEPIERNGDWYGYLWWHET